MINEKNDIFDIRSSKKNSSIISQRLSQKEKVGEEYYIIFEGFVKTYLNLIIEELQ